MARIDLGEKVAVWQNRGIDGWRTRPGHIVGIFGRWPRRRYAIVVPPSEQAVIYKRREFHRLRPPL